MQVLSPPIHGADPDPELARAHPEHVGKPDGVPHDVVGTLASAAVLAALLTGALYVLFGVLVAVIVALVLTPLFVVRLTRRAAGERTEEAYGLPSGSVTKSSNPTAHPPVDVHRGDRSHFLG